MRHRNQMGKWLHLRLFIGVGIIGILSACAGATQDSGVTKTEKVRAFDGVKFISTDIKHGNDARSFHQLKYTLNSHSRLLLRYEGIDSIRDDVSQDHQSVILRIQLQEPGDRTLWRNRIRVCPLETNWMMAATWERAHPFPGGEWSQPGGDIASSDCLSFMEFPAEEEPSFETTFLEEGTAPPKETDDPDDGDMNPPPQEPDQELFMACKEDELSLCFDLTDWFHSYVLERGVNWGLALVVDGPLEITVLGDRSAKGPRLHWVEDSWEKETSPTTLRFQ